MSQQFGFDRLVEICSCTHEKARQSAPRTIDRWSVVRNWLFGWFIVEYEQKGADRAEYGGQTLSKLSAALQGGIGRGGVSVDALEKMRRFYMVYEHTLSAASDAEKSATLSRISPSLSPRVPIRPSELAEKISLGWSHYVTLLSVVNPDARRFY